MESRLKRCFSWPLFLVFVFISIELPYDAAGLINKKSQLPNITIVATGGTIAGATGSSDGTTNYEAGVLSIDTITQGIGKELRTRANIDVEQFMNVDSININASLAISLSQHITKLVADPLIHGVVLTHGTDLMTEIAAFLALTVTSDKPIVMTGAIKPHTAIGADGPGNIVAAVNTATTTGWSSMGHEVIIVIQDKVMAPWGTKKENNLFLPGPRSLLGDIVDFKPFFR